MWRLWLSTLRGLRTMTYSTASLGSIMKEVQEFLLLISLFLEVWEQTITKCQQQQDGLWPQRRDFGSKIENWLTSAVCSNDCMNAKFCRGRE